MDRASDSKPEYVGSYPTRPAKKRRFMALEIERKFLIKDLSCIKSIKGKEILQGYISKDPVVRVRTVIYSDIKESYMTVKGSTEGITRSETEFQIDNVVAQELFAFCKETIWKTRYLVRNGKDKWEVDVFHGPLQGLVIAEIELNTEDQQVELPAWIGNEVSLMSKYFNSNLVGKSFKDLI